MKRLLLLGILAFPSSLFAERPSCTRPQRLFAAFETDYLQRDRQGGAWQEGLLFGGRIGWDRVKPKGFYWGLNGYYLSGTLMGQAANGCYAESDFQVGEIEGRLGWTFACRTGWRFSFTPFLGYGHYRERNRFHQNCPMTVLFRASYYELPLGFLTSLSPSPYFTFGLNAKLGLMHHARNRISGDPEQAPRKQTTSDRPQYTIELPLTLYPCAGRRRLEVSLVPFYRFRHFGARENYPFNFYETRLSYYGARVELGLRW